jgi:hypothetical protein
MFSGGSGGGPNSDTPIIAAIIYDRVDILDLMHQLGTPITCSVKGKSLFDYAREYKSQKVNEYLLQHLMKPPKPNFDTIVLKAVRFQ